MSCRQTAGLIAAVLIPTLALAVLPVIAGCKKSESGETGTKRVSIGGEEAAELAAEEEGGARTDAPAEEQPAETETADAAPRRAAGPGGPAGRPGRPGGMGPAAARGTAAGRAPAAAAAEAPEAAAAETPEAAAAETPEADETDAAAEGEEEEAPAAETGIPEVDVAKKVNEFASLYGPVSRVKEKYWNDNTTEWLLFTYDGENKRAKGRRIKLPLSMVADTNDQSVLEGYFPIYAVTALRPSGEVVSRQEISVPRITMEEYKLEIAARRKAARAEAEAKAEAAGAEATTGRAAPAGPPAGGPPGRRGPGTGPPGRMGRP